MRTKSDQELAMYSKKVYFMSISNIDSQKSIRSIIFLTQTRLFMLIFKRSLDNFDSYSQYRIVICAFLSSILFLPTKG